MNYQKIYKSFIMISAMMIAFSLAGCSTSKTSAPASASSNVSAQNASGENEAGSNGVQQIISRGVLNVGVKLDVPNFGYKDPKTGKIDGFEIDIAKAMAKDILGDSSKLNMEGVTAQTRGPLLDNGELDMDICTFTITDERKKSYNFSDPYYTDGVALMVKKNSGIKSLTDLNGKTIGVAQSSTTKDSLVSAAEKKNIKLNFSEFSTYPEIKAALSSGRVDCFSVDGAILSGYKDNTVEILPDRYSPQHYGVATKLSNKKLAERVNTVLKKMNESGEMQKLLKKWGLNK